MGGDKWSKQQAGSSQCAVGRDDRRRQKGCSRLPPDPAGRPGHRRSYVTGPFGRPRLAGTRSTARSPLRRSDGVCGRRVSSWVAINGQNSKQAAANAPSAATIKGGKRDVLASLPTPPAAPADCGRADMTGAVRPAEPCRGSADSIATSSMGGDGFDVRCGGQLSSVSYHSESPDSRSFTPGTTGAFTEGGGFHSHRPSSRFAKCLCVCVCGLCTRTLLQISENTDRWK